MRGYLLQQLPTLHYSPPQHDLATPDATRPDAVLMPAPMAACCRPSILTKTICCGIPQANLDTHYRQQPTTAPLPRSAARLAQSQFGLRLL
ncbi:hypothetical protein [uncultured Acinetobacter sp.]|uniref:hypothetical protein n=1 Tax=uncultured Acinetobacter sp. TaxID=165433 RepID=UPI002619A85F|nr:hypothetical protein [uncultured Acinetobacter sp.]